MRRKSCEGRRWSRMKVSLNKPERVFLENVLSKIQKKKSVTFYDFHICEMIRNKINMLVATGEGEGE